MKPFQQKVIVAGHVCLDVIPSFQGDHRSDRQIFTPGSLTEVGPVIMSLGGAVANTGLALYKLGVNTKLIGKVGNDAFGQTIIDALCNHDPRLGDSILVEEQDHTSYTIIISPPETDRTFLHHPGSNRTFCSDDVSLDALADAALFHFGYPPFMEKMLVNDGEELVKLLQKVKKQGITTSLDMAKPDPNNRSGNIDWKRYLSRVLPYVDIFIPSIEELWFMLEEENYNHWIENGNLDLNSTLHSSLLRRLADTALDMGAAVVGIKLGDQGVYFKISSNVDRFKKMGRSTPILLDSWVGREIIVPPYAVEAAGTTGAGDCTIAGFLTGMLRGWTLQEAANFAAAVGAFSVERMDATSGIPGEDIVLSRMKSGWERRTIQLPIPEFSWNDATETFNREC